MAKTEVNGINIHNWQVGDTGEDLILIHGLTGNLAIWHFTLVPAFRHDFRVLTYDLRGHGRSDMPLTGYTTRHMVEDLLGLMDALKIEKAHLLGHSLGADIALHTAVLAPDRVNKIVAVEAGTAALVQLRLKKDWPGWEEWAKGIERYAGIKIPADKWHDVDYMLRESLKIPVVFGPGRGLPRKGDRIRQLLDTTTLVEEYQDTSGLTLEAITKIQNPVLLMYGSKSNYLGTYEVLREALPNHAEVLLDGSEHFGALERPEEMAKHTRAFLQGEVSPNGRHDSLV